MTTLTVGELARRAAVGVETVRFYEKQGLLHPPRRADSGYRQYDDETVQILCFIRRAKELGFTLKQIKGLLELQSDKTLSRSEIRRVAQSKVEEIQAKIEDLQRMRDSLQAVVDQCHGDGSIAGCPILAAMQGPDLNQV